MHFVRSIAPSVTITALAAGLSGCLAGTSLQTAHPIGKNELQVAVEPGIVGASVEGTAAALPSFNFAFRYGVSDRADFGARLGTIGYEITYKQTLTDPTAGGTQMAIAPSLSTFFIAAGGAGGGWFNVKVPFLFGIPVGKSELVVGPRANLTTLFGGGSGAGSGAASVLALGGQIGFAARVGETVQLLPELGLAFPAIAAAASSGGSSSTSIDISGTAFSFQLGLLFGGR